MMPSRLLFGLWSAGWFQLVRRYPDKGSLCDVAWHPALFWLDIKPFPVIASANQHGLRVALSLHPDAIFVPWPDAAISAKRGWLSTVIRIRLAASPGVALVIDADDEAADDLLRPAGIVPSPRKCKWCHWIWVGIGLAVFVGLIITVTVLCQ
jgi:hypothetical protein